MNRLTSGWSESPQGATASFADVLRMARSVLPAALVDEDGWKRLAARAGHLPPSAADALFGFECRLDQREASADLVLSAPANARFAAALVREGATAAPRAAALARLLSALRQPGSIFARAVDLVMLEYDVAGVEHTPAPGFFLRNRAESGYAGARVPTAAIALAAGWYEDPHERHEVARVFAALPPKAAVRWVGAFPDRGRAVRLLIRALGDGVAAFLAQIGWHGDITTVYRILSSLRACGLDNHVLALDVVDGAVVPRIGLELSRTPLRTDAAGSWRQALELMVREGWCLPEKAKALGLVTRSERLFSPAGVSELHCGIHHVKLSVPEGNDAVSAKGYVAGVLRPLS